MECKQRRSDVPRSSEDDLLSKQSSHQNVVDSKRKRSTCSGSFVNNKVLKSSLCESVQVSKRRIINTPNSCENTKPLSPALYLDVIDKLENSCIEANLRFQKNFFNPKKVEVFHSKFSIFITLARDGTVEEVLLNGLCDTEEQRKRVVLYIKTIVDLKLFADLKAVLKELEKKHDFTHKERAELWAKHAFHTIKSDTIKFYLHHKNKNIGWPQDIIFNKFGKVEYDAEKDILSIIYFYEHKDFDHWAGQRVNYFDYNLSQQEIACEYSMKINLTDSSPQKFRIHSSADFSRVKVGHILKDFFEKTKCKSFTMPSCCSLDFNSPLLIENSIIEKINTSLEGLCIISKHNLNLVPSLIHSPTENDDDRSLRKKGFIKTVQGNSFHCFINSNVKCSEVKAIHFVTTSQIPKILQLLKFQAQFNALIRSLSPNIPHPCNNDTTCKTTNENCKIKVLVVDMEHLELNIKYAKDTKKINMKIDLSILGKPKVDCKINKIPVPERLNKYLGNGLYTFMSISHLVNWMICNY